MSDLFLKILQNFLESCFVEYLWMKILIITVLKVCLVLFLFSCLLCFIWFLHFVCLLFAFWFSVLSSSLIHFGYLLERMMDLTPARVNDRITKIWVERGKWLFSYQPDRRCTEPFLPIQAGKNTKEDWILSGYHILVRKLQRCIESPIKHQRWSVLQK